MKLNHKGAVDLMVIGLLFVVVFVAGFAIWRLQPAGDKGDTCNFADGVSYCLTTNSDSVSGSDKIVLISRITNNRTETIFETFPCVDNDPYFVVNDEPIYGSGLCLTAISEVEIKPGETKEYVNSLSGSRLNPGDNQVYANWVDFKSNSLTISREDDTEKDNQVYEQCLQGIAHISCVSITVKVEGNYKNHTCEYYESLYAPLEIKPAEWFCEDDYPGLGFIPFYVPRDDADKWREILRTVPEFYVYDE